MDSVGQPVVDLIQEQQWVGVYDWWFAWRTGHKNEQYGEGANHGGSRQGGKVVIPYRLLASASSIDGRGSSVRSSIRLCCQ